MSLMRRLGLTQDELRMLIEDGGLKHSTVCRSINGPGLGYYCICNFFETVAIRAWSKVNLFMIDLTLIAVMDTVRDAEDRMQRGSSFDQAAYELCLRPKTLRGFFQIAKNVGAW
jgi:hypothetical protein